MAKYIVKEHQSLMDVSIQHFGNLEDGLFKILTDNPSLNANSKLSSAQRLEVNPSGLGNANIKEFLANQDFFVMNKDEAGLSSSFGDYNDDYNNDFSNQ